MTAGMFSKVMAANQPRFAELAKAMAGTNQLRLTELSRVIGTVYSPHLAKFSNPASTLNILAISDPTLFQIGSLVAESINSGVQDSSSVSNGETGQLQKISDREVAAMLTVAVFLLVYISLGLVIKHNTQLAHLAATDEPTPFEAAMAAGALTFWAWMTYSRRSS